MCGVLQICCLLAHCQWVQAYITLNLGSGQSFCIQELNSCETKALKLVH